MNCNSPNLDFLTPKALQEYLFDPEWPSFAPTNN